MESMDNRPLPIQTELFKPKEAKLFSGLGVKNLLGEELKVPNETSPTLLAVGLNQLSFGMLESWVNAIWEDQTVPPSNLAIIQLSVVESKWAVLRLLLLAHAVVVGWLFRMLSWMILFPMRSRVNPALHKVTAVYFGSFKGYKAELGIQNILFGHLFLIDSHGRIRWKAAGSATEEEVKALKDCIAEVIAEK